jgi:peptide-methionine (R)-S-oxide reductase
MKKTFAVMLALVLFPSLAPVAEAKLKKIHRSEEEWKKILTPEQYRIMRAKGTEIACSGEYWQNDQDGVYACTACGLPLFDSKDKFASKSGWPSFLRPFAPDHVIESKDTSYGMVRTSIECGRCDGHLGHVFEDGPRPTGLRYCINSVSMKFVPRADFKPEPE